MIQPIRDNVLIKRHNGLGVTSGGILIADSFAEKPAKGVIIAKGTKANVKEGTTCYFILTAGTPIVDEGIEYLLMPAREILGYTEN